jgi:hypothetical protein
MGESALEPAEHTEPRRAQPVSVVELYEEALRKRGFASDHSLVDVLYDERVKLIVSAEAPPEQLLLRDAEPGDARLQAMVFQFDRTVSRLTEMQTREYLDQPRLRHGQEPVLEGANTHETADGRR